MASSIKATATNACHRGRRDRDMSTRLPERFDPIKAAVAEPAATALHAVGAADRVLWRPLAESRALVLGAGAVGLSAALVLRSRGVREVAIGDTNPLRRETAQSAGGLEMV